LKNLSAIKPIIKGATIAPHDWVEKTAAVSEPEAERFLSRKVPKVTNHDHQIKNSRNIMIDNLTRLVVFIFGFSLFFKS